VAPLQNLLQGKKPRSAPLLFNKEADVAFDKLKLALCNHTTLAHPRSEADTVLVSDASNFGCGASIMQRLTTHGVQSRFSLKALLLHNASTPRFPENVSDCTLLSNTFVITLRAILT